MRARPPAQAVSTSQRGLGPGHVRRTVVLTGQRLKTVQNALTIHYGDRIQAAN
jgi:hypothetical protein